MTDLLYHLIAPISGSFYATGPRTVATTPEVTPEELQLSAQDAYLPPELVAAKMAADAAIPSTLSPEQQAELLAHVKVYPSHPVVGMMSDMTTGMMDIDYRKVSTASIQGGYGVGFLTDAEYDAAIQRRADLLESDLDATLLARIKGQ